MSDTINDTILAEDYRCTADMLRCYMNMRDQSLFRAVCSNNLAIILSALAQAEAYRLGYEQGLRDSQPEATQ